MGRMGRIGRIGRIGRTGRRARIDVVAAHRVRVRPVCVKSDSATIDARDA